MKRKTDIKTISEGRNLSKWYMDRVSELLQERKEKDAHEKSYMKSGSQQLNEALKRNTEEYEQLKNEAFSKMMNDWDKITTPIVEELQAEITKIDSKAIDDVEKIKLFSGHQIGQATFDVLVSKYNNGFVQEMELRKLAIKNNLIHPNIDSDYDTKISKIEEVYSLLKGLSEYDPDNLSYSLLNSVSDKNFDRIEREYTQNYSNYELTPKMKAERLIAASSYQNDFIERQVYLKNGYEKSDEHTKMEILYQLSNIKNNGELPHYAKFMEDIINEFEMNEKDFYVDASNQIDELEKIQNITACNNAITEIRMKTNNKYFMQLLEDRAKSSVNDNFCKAVELEKEYLEDLAENQKIVNGGIDNE